MLANRSIEQLSLFTAQHEPAAWDVRVSVRARRLSVRVYPAGRVEVVVPNRTPARMVEDFVRRHRDWIEARLRECVTPQQATLPEELLLPAIERCVRIAQVPTHVSRLQPRLRVVNPQHLEVIGQSTDIRGWAPSLTRWLAQVAQREFEPRLRLLANDCGFTYERLQIRRQRTRWGSCSIRGTISLNLCGLFIRPEVLRYLMIHELCHTAHMNHSKRFWSLVAHHEPEYRRLDRELTRAWQFVPSWLFLG